MVQLFYMVQLIYFVLYINSYTVKFYSLILYGTTNLYMVQNLFCYLFTVKNLFMVKNLFFSVYIIVTLIYPHQFILS